MHSHIFVISIFTLLLQNLVSFAQWERRYPELPADAISDLHFFDEFTGVFVNEGGSVYKTTDGGNTWTLKAHYQRDALAKMEVLDNQFLFVSSPQMYLGDDLRFLFSTDRGETWTAHNIDVFAYDEFLPLSTSILIKGSYQTGTIAKLDNFFNNWREVFRMPYFTYIGDDYIFELPYGCITDFQKLNNRRILALANSFNAREHGIIADSVSLILQSDNEGETWDTLWVGLPHLMNKFRFINDQVGWMAGEEQRIYKTTDGGNNWALQHQGPMYSGSPQDMFVLSETHVYFVAGTQLLYTTDGGETWQSSTITNYGVEKVWFINETNGLVVGADIFETTDGGVTWQRRSDAIRDDILHMDFVNKDIGIALGSRGIYRTTDGGYHWSAQKIFDGAFHSLAGLDMVNEQVGWVVTIDSIYHTSDGGVTWQSIVADSQACLANMGLTFWDENIGMVFNLFAETVPGSNNCDASFHLLTNDGGMTWQRLPVQGGASNFKKVQFTGSNQLWALNQDGLWYSRNSGANWDSIPRWADRFSSFHFIDSLTGWMALHDEFAEYTTDGGESWVMISKPHRAEVNDLEMIERDRSGRFRIYMACYDGSLLEFYQSNAIEGRSRKTFTRRSLNSIATVLDGDRPHIWVAGDGFTILHHEAALVGMEQEDPPAQKHFWLAQNYPNPFNSSTIITYFLPKATHVELIVFDALGKKVRTLLSEMQTPGEKRIVWDGKNFHGQEAASGIYFYQLNTADFFKSRKMLLLR